VVFGRIVSYAYIDGNILYNRVFPQFTAQGVEPRMEDFYPDGLTLGPAKLVDLDAAAGGQPASDDTIKPGVFFKLVLTGPIISGLYPAITYYFSDSFEKVYKAQP